MSQITEYVNFFYNKTVDFGSQVYENGSEILNQTLDKSGKVYDYVKESIPPEFINKVSELYSSVKNGVDSIDVARTTVLAGLLTVSILNVSVLYLKNDKLPKSQKYIFGASTCALLGLAAAQGYKIALEKGIFA